MVWRKIIRFYSFSFQFFLYKVALYKEMIAESKANSVHNGSSHPKNAPTHEEQVMQVTAQFPSLKGFLN